MKKTVILILLFILVSRPGIAQNDSPTPKKEQNVIHADFGLIGFNVNYEKTFHKFRRSHLNFRTGLGYVIDFDLYGNVNLIGSVQYIIGNGFLHFETGLGINFMLHEAYGGAIEPGFMPLVMVGLRFEPPGPGPVFRVGVGTEGSLMSAGVGLKF